MANIVINQDKVSGSQINSILEVCPFGSISYKNNILDIDSGCKMCRQCVKKYGDIFSLQEQSKSIDKAEWQNIAVYIEVFNGQIHNVSLELLGEAKKLADKVGQKVVALVIGYQLSEVIETLKEYFVDEIYVYDNEKLANFSNENYMLCVEDFIDSTKVSSMLFGATMLGRSFAPIVASTYKTGLTADCTFLDIKENGDLVQVRPAFGGNIMAQIITASNRPQLATVRNKVFDVAIKSDNEKTIIKRDIKIDTTKNKVALISEKIKEQSLQIEDAEVIVAVGRGVDMKNDFEKIETLAKSLDGVIACSRPMMEEGYFDNKKQIGLSGRTVKPKLIICIGISGAIQFLVGMQNSDYIISINTDANCELSKIANVAVTADYKTIIEPLTKKIRGQSDV